jgi:hypothetical protein
LYMISPPRLPLTPFPFLAQKDHKTYKAPKSDIKRKARMTTAKDAMVAKKMQKKTRTSHH